MDKSPSFDSTFPFYERRQSPRRKDSITVHFMGKDVDGSFFAVEIGGGGIRLYTRTPLEHDQPYEFDLMVEPIHRAIRVKATVAWERPLNIHDVIYEVGLVFQEIAAEHRKFLEEYAQGWLRTPEDRRNSPRAPRLLDASVIRETGKSAFSGYILELGEDGCRFVTEVAIEEKEAVILNVELEEGSSVSLEGRIQWSNHSQSLSKILPGMEYIYGMKFQIDSVDVQALVNAFVKSQNRAIETNLVRSLLDVGKHSG